MSKLTYWLLSFSLALPVMAEEIMTIESQITGSVEQPRMLVIIPWRSPEKDPDSQTDNKPMQDDIRDFAFTPIERKSFIQSNELLLQMLAVPEASE